MYKIEISFLICLIAGFAVASEQESTLICFGGGTAAGKTTFVKRLEKELEDQAAVVELDRYYLDYPHLTLDERQRLNWDHPSALDWFNIKEQLGSLKRGHVVQAPVRDFETFSAAKETFPISPAKYLIVEGIHMFHDREVRENLCNHLVYIDVPAGQRLARRIVRDREHRGSSEEATIGAYNAFVKPMHDEFVEPTKHYPKVQIVTVDELDEFLPIFMASLQPRQF